MATTNDFASAMEQALGKVTTSKTTGKKKSKIKRYQGLDFGEFVDYEKVKKQLMTAVNQLPKEEIPENIEEYTLTVVIHGDGTGAAWMMDENPYKTWAWRKR